MYYLYILYAANANKYYVGYTNDYLSRLDEHNTSDRLTFTSKHRPWRLEAVFACGEDEGNAIKLERFIKRQKSKKLLTYMINGGVLEGILAQLVRVPHVRD